MQPALSYPSSGGALRYGRVADRIRVCLRGVLPRFLRHRAFLDADQRLAVRPVENVDPPGASGLGNSLARLTVDDGVEENDGARQVVIPDVVVHLLEVPGVFARLGVQCDNGGAEKLSPSRIDPS